MVVTKLSEKTKNIILCVVVAVLFIGIILFGIFGGVSPTQPEDHINAMHLN